MNARQSRRAALAELTAQHEDLRERIAACEELLARAEAGRASEAELLHEVSGLRLAFDAHNQHEEGLLEPLLRDADWLGAVRVSRMVEDHLEEHRAMRLELDSSTSSALRAVLITLRAHLETEERYLLSRRVLRDDLA